MSKRAVRFVWLAVVTALVPILAWGHPATVVLDLIWEHVGSKSQYEKVRYIEFTWAAEEDGETKTTRKHTWDRYEGDYVLEFTDAKTGDGYKVYFNVDSKKGVALRNGEAVDEAENQELVDRAYAMFINDTYWLLVPTKLEDFGARVQFVGHAGKPEAHGSEGEFIVLHLFFVKDVGLTPGDEYWLYVRHSGQIAKWRYVLESGREGEWDWSDEKDCGMGIVLATRKVSTEANRAIVFPHVKLSETMDRGVFENAADK
jgi:hypothetical protein